MTINFNGLRALSPEALVQAARDQGVYWHPNKKEATIIKEARENPDKIIDMIKEAIMPKNEAPKEIPEAKMETWLTEQDVEDMVAAIKARQPKFETIYDHEARCVTFRCLGAEDCHSLSTSKRWLKLKADLVSRGRLSLRSLQDFDKINNSPHNAYTGTVIPG